MDADVVVIGAGLAGLRAARRLERSGRSVIVLESAEAVGGRVRTDLIDGFRCDRGFQILNPAYPAVRRWVDVRTLDLQRFGVGAALSDDAGITVLAHPLRHPRYAGQTLRNPHVTARDVIGLARFAGPALLRAGAAIRSGRDTTLRDALDRSGLTGPLRRDMLDVFLAGVLADGSGLTSADFVRLLLRSFALGAPGVPSNGMQALPEQLAASLTRPVRTGTAVRAVQHTDHGVRVHTDGGEISAAAAVVAVGPRDVAALTDLPSPSTHGLTTWWFAAPEPPRRGPFLVLDARPGGPRGPVWNTAVLSEVAPSYAPPGRSLVQATTLLDRVDGTAGVADVLRHLARIYRIATRGWEVVAHHILPHALPAQPPPLDVRRPQRVGRRVLVAGDHRDTASIQGALVSGDRAGVALDRLLRAGD